MQESWSCTCTSACIVFYCSGNQLRPHASQQIKQESRHKNGHATKPFSHHFADLLVMDSVWDSFRLTSGSVSSTHTCQSFLPSGVVGHNELASFLLFCLRLQTRKLSLDGFVDQRPLLFCVVHHLQNRGAYWKRVLSINGYCSNLWGRFVMTQHSSDVQDYICGTPHFLCIKEQISCRWSINKIKGTLSLSMTLCFSCMSLWIIRLYKVATNAVHAHCTVNVSRFGTQP